MTKLTAHEVETIRRLQLNARRTVLNAQQAQLDLDLYILELEAKYQIVDKQMKLDIQTGTLVSLEAGGGLDGNEEEEVDTGGN